MSEGKGLVPFDQVQSAIVTLRGIRVILDKDLAALYGVTTKRLNEQAKRNIERFPSDFMFQLAPEEAAALRSQSATSKTGRGGLRYLPYAFTEHGAIMAASVLNTPRAIEMSIFVVRAFVHLRQVLASHRGLADKLVELEKKIGTHDRQIGAIFEALRRGLSEAGEGVNPLPPSGVNPLGSTLSPFGNHPGLTQDMLGQAGRFIQLPPFIQRAGCFSKSRVMLKMPGTKPYALSLMERIGNAQTLIGFKVKEKAAAYGTRRRRQINV